ncbi:MOSC domain-containing protein [Marinicella litoralis]|uniref:MOSC domain-containing protein n=1 Tax=Marinicella litoralis TaxID=644220 RepID=A0A4R6Y309_9GAMM|nr:MOSC N-terminal beta barrel domain-containing protein [Marinicella litoralis]TDR23408.1 hypothetical protein C8D91_0269 [Marinicella litoralis]
MPAEISHLYTYPIKSCAAISHDTITINAMGLEGDRKWMLVDEEGVFLSQRKYPKMALIQPQLTDSKLTLSAPGMQQLSIDLTTTGHNRNVTIWQDSLTAHVISHQANDWFSTYLGVAVQLVHYAANSFRQIDLAFSKPGQPVAFADGYPILLTHQATLEQLNKSLTHAVAMSRFRPNIVVQSTEPAWSELDWNELSIDNLKLNLVKPCARCVMTGIEQQTGTQTGTEVLLTLKQKFPHQDKAVFGINAIPDTAGVHDSRLQVGMHLSITQKPDAE